MSKQVRQKPSDEQLSRGCISAVVKPRISSHSSGCALGQGYFCFFNRKSNLMILFYEGVVHFAYKEHQTY